MNYTFLTLAEETLRRIGRPLSGEEIWKEAAALGIQDKCGSSGQTPWRSIGAQIYVSIKEDEQSKFYKASAKPTRFGLKGVTALPTPAVSAAETARKFYERDLHPLLSAYVFSDQHFLCYTKTIFHEISDKKKKGKNKWLHPDLVGVYFPFGNYNESTVSVLETFSESAIKLFSFEMKIKITLADLRENYFQAVSNSSWAHEGYLVALDYEDSDDLMDEMQSLSVAFGIGFIQLNAEHIEQSQILIPARTRGTVDWSMVDRLVGENRDFKAFIDSINEDNKVKKVKSKYDEILKTDALQKYISDKKIL